MYISEYILFFPNSQWLIKIRNNFKNMYKATCGNDNNYSNNNKTKQKRSGKQMYI